MDGTLLNTESLYTQAASDLLAKYGKGPLTWDVKIHLQGRPISEASRIVVKEYEIPLTPEEFVKQSMIIQQDYWPQTKFLPGALELIEYLSERNFPIALGTSSTGVNYERKTNHLGHGFKHFKHHIVTGDDARIPPGKGKPEPHIWYACLDSLNAERLQLGLEPIRIEECLVFEDGVPGVISGINANAYVIWIPDPEALRVLDGKEAEIIGDRGEILSSLVAFDKSKYFL